MGPSSAGRRRGSVGVPLNYAVVPRSAEWDRLVPGGGGEIPLQ